VGTTVIFARSGECVVKRPPAWLALLVVALVAVGALVYVVATHDDSVATDPEPTGEQGPKGLAQYYTQDLDWEDCGEGRCATVEVPIEYEDPDGETTELRVVVFEAPGKNDRSLFINPGGPGGSAIEYADYVREEFGKPVLGLYDIVGVDPRGVGLSSPLDCISDKQRDEAAASDPDPDTATEIQEARARFTAHGKGCVEDAGALASHVSTAEFARDLDVVRALVGSKTFDWFGASYGTLLGGAYATLFPDRVGRMVLDGAVDPSEDAEESSFRSVVAFQRALDAYIEDCVNDKGCPLGDSVREAIDNVDGLLQDLETKPMRTETYRELTKGMGMGAIGGALYEKAAWPQLTEALTRAFEGDGTGLLVIGDLITERAPTGDYLSNRGEVAPAIGCLDGDERGTVADVKAAKPRFEKASPIFGESAVWGLMGCDGWPIKTTHPFPDLDGAGAEPILIIGTTRDPATPVEWAEAMADQLDSGVLVTRDGDGHTAYGSGNDCIDDLVDDFLVEGTVPKDGTTCAE
jgi:pimeloyl-ACP methyl ester carboxylesterase